MPLRLKRNQNPNRSNRKNRKLHRISNPKTENQMLKNGKSTNCNEHQNRKTKVFWHKNRKTDLKHSQNCKTENPNPPSYWRFQICMFPHNKLHKGQPTHLEISKQSLSLKVASSYSSQKGTIQKLLIAHKFFATFVAKHCYNLVQFSPFT